MSVSLSEPLHFGMSSGKPCKPPPAFSLWFEKEGKAEVLAAGWGGEESDMVQQGSLMWHSEELKETKSRYTRETVNEMEKWRKECVVRRKEQEQGEVPSVGGQRRGQVREEGGKGVKRKGEYVDKVKIVRGSENDDARKGAGEVKADKEEVKADEDEAVAGEKEPLIKKKKIGKKKKLELEKEKKKKFEKAMDDVLSGRIPNIKTVAKVHGLHPSSLRGCLDSRLLGKGAKLYFSSNLIKFSCGYT